MVKKIYAKLLKIKNDEISLKYYQRKRKELMKNLITLYKTRSSKVCKHIFRVQIFKVELCFQISYNLI